MDCPSSTYAELPVRVTFFTPYCHEGMCAYQGVGNVFLGGDFADVLCGCSLSMLNYSISLEFDL